MTQSAKHIALLTAFGVVLACAIVLLTQGQRSRLNAIATAMPAVIAEERALFEDLAARPKADADDGVSAVAWPQTTVAEVEIAMQTALLDAAAASGLEVISFGGMGPDDRCAVTCATYEAELSGGHEQAVSFLAAIEQIRPALSVGSLWMRQLPPDGVSTAARVNLRISVWGFVPAISAGGVP